MPRKSAVAEWMKPRARVIREEYFQGIFPAHIHVWAVYAGGNTLRFRCPYCGTIERHGAGELGEEVHTGTPYFHCQRYGMHPDDGDCVWVMHEILEGMDLSLAGDLGKETKLVCPRRLGEPGYDQLGNGSINYAQKPGALIKAYKIGRNHG